MLIFVELQYDSIQRIKTFNNTHSNVKDKYKAQNTQVIRLIHGMSVKTTYHIIDMFYKTATNPIIDQIRLAQSITGL